MGELRVITVREWQEHVVSLVRPLAPVHAAVEECAGLVLAADVVAAVALPGFDNSAMDGYAVRRADLLGASAQAPVVLPVDGDVRAGSSPSALQPGRALRIMTGAPLPAGADAVVQVEHTDGGVERVSVHRVPDEHMHIRRAGTDCAPGDLVLPAGVLVDAHRLGILVSVGVSAVPVVPRPRVVVLTTGDELVPPGRTPGPGQVVDSNGPTLVAALRAGGFDAVRQHATTDDEQDVRAAVEDACALADAVITTGGVSMGAYDPVKAVLREQVRFERVAMQPGKPQGAGVLDGTPVLCLPGNPVSALVSYLVLVEPALLTMAGRPTPDRWTPLPAVHGWRSPADREQYVRVVVGADGVRLAGGQGSYVLSSLAAADALARVPVGVDEVRPGDLVAVRRL